MSSFYWKGIFCVSSNVPHSESRTNVLDEIVNWAKDSTAQLGCTPCTLAVGIGRSHFEASSLMLQALVDGNYNILTLCRLCFWFSWSHKI